MIVAIFFERINYLFVVVIRLAIICIVLAPRTWCTSGGFLHDELRKAEVFMVEGIVKARTEEKLHTKTALLKNLICQELTFFANA